MIIANKKNQNKLNVYTNQLFKNRPPLPVEIHL